MNDLDVAGAELWFENFTTFEHFQLIKFTDTHYEISWQQGPLAKFRIRLFNCYFHLEGMILEVAFKMSPLERPAPDSLVMMPGWHKFPYATPDYPFDANDQIYRLFDLFLEPARTSIGEPEFQRLQGRVNVLRAENKRLHLGLGLGVAG